MTKVLQFQSLVIPRTPPAGPVGPLAPDRYIIITTRHFVRTASGKWFASKHNCTGNLWSLRVKTEYHLRLKHWNSC
jgi:hypothetical protein